MLISLSAISKKNRVSEGVKTLIRNTVKSEKRVTAEINVKSYLFTLKASGHIKGVLEECTPTIVTPTIANIKLFPFIIKEFIIVNTFINTFLHFPSRNGFNIGVNSFFEVFDFKRSNIVKRENTSLFALSGIAPIINVSIHSIKCCYSVHVFNLSQIHRPFSNRKVKKLTQTFRFYYLFQYSIIRRKWQEEKQKYNSVADH